MAKGILAILGKTGKPSSDSGEEDLGSEAKRLAAQDLLSAVKKGDADQLVAAYERLHEACVSSRMDDDDEDEDFEDDY